MLGLAQNAGHELTNDAATADVLVVNTCAFIDSAKQESIDAILEMAELKKNGACRRLVVTGCLAERYREQLQAEIPEIDAVLGTGEVPEIVRAIGGSRRRRPSPSFARVTLVSRRRSVAGRSRRPSRRARATVVHLRRRYAEAAGHAEALRLREDRRRLRLQVRVLHHPDAARRLSEPPRRFDRPGGARAGGARRQGTAAHLAGHDLLRHRPSRARRAGPPAARAESDRRPGLDPPALSLSDHDRRRDARGDGGVREGLQVHRSAAAARVESGARADEAAGQPAEVRRAAPPHSRARPRRRASHHVHRRLPGRDRRRTSRSCANSCPITRSTMSASSPIPTRKARPRSRWTTTCRRRRRRRAGRASWACRSGSWPSGIGRGSASARASSSTVPPASTSSS